MAHMEDRPAERARRVLIAGGGVAAVEGVLALRHLAGPRVAVELLAPTHDFVLPAFDVARPFGDGEPARLRLKRLARELGAGHIFDTLAAVLPERHAVRTGSGAELRYDALLIATGARPEEALPGALTFPGRDGVAGYRTLLGDLERRVVDDVVFAVPAGTAWSLPLYELALQTSAWLAERGVHGVRLRVTTPERAPLGAFGGRAAGVVADALDRAGIGLRTGVRPLEVREGALWLADGDALRADRVVSLARPIGPSLPGLPADVDGFLPVDAHGRVRDVADVYAAGDVTSRPFKQGGLAAQQADAAAEAIAEWAGAPVRPTPFHPVLRGVLLTGDSPAFLRADLDPHRSSSLARSTPMWWPPAKVAGRYLAPFLAAHGMAMPPSARPR